MDMVKLHSMEDMLSLPVTSWNIHQPAGDCLVIVLLKMVHPFASALVFCTSQVGSRNIGFLKGTSTLTTSFDVKLLQMSKL